MHVSLEEGFCGTHRTLSRSSISDEAIVCVAFFGKNISSTFATYTDDEQFPEQAFVQALLRVKM